MEPIRMDGARVAFSVVLAVGFAAATVALAPRGYDAGSLLAAQDDPVRIADHGLAKRLDAPLASREIEDALASGDADLAASFLELARDRGLVVDPSLAARVDAANSAAASATRGAGSFALGLLTGEPDDLPGLAGTAVGDLMVFGDIRDAVREGTRFASGQPVDDLVLGLSVLGLAITAGTYATLGVGTPARVGLSVVKAARKTGRLGGRMAEWIGRTMRDAIDWSLLSGAVSKLTVSEPLVAIRTARSAVRMEKGGDILRLVGNVGEVQAKAGTKAAMDGLKLAEGPRDMARVARLAQAKGGKTRAILKTLGRGAIALTLGTLNLASWAMGALLSLAAFLVSLKSAAERATLRRLRRRKLARVRMVTYARA